VTDTSSKSVAVIGGGITGLTAAFRLMQRGHRVRVFEAATRVGGVIRTERSEGWLIESGPNSLLSDDHAVPRLIADLGIGSELVRANAAARKRYIVRDGMPVAAPVSPPALLGSPLFSARAKFQIVAEMLRRPRLRTSDVSLEEFVLDHFGQEVVDYGLNPFVRGVYAGNPKHLSARLAFPKLWEGEQKHGSILRGQIAAAKAGRGRERVGIVSFRDGLEALPQALAARLPAGTLTLNARVNVLLPDGSGGWCIEWNDGASNQCAAFDAIIAAIPAAALAQLRFERQSERPLRTLDQIEHPPVSSVFLGFRSDQVRHPLDGFGMLVPEIERRSILGVLFSSTLFPGRAPEGHVALTVLVGGTRNVGLAKLPNPQLLATIQPDLEQLLGVQGEPVFQRHTFWPQAIPQYNLGYERHVETMVAAEQRYPGLFIGGQARDGISVPACIAGGERLAGGIA
jgi:protoporphyrinogen/coproporphyrinogen III oxidase